MDEGKLSGEGAEVRGPDHQTVDASLVVDEATSLFRQHIAFGESKEGEPFAMMGDKKIVDPGIVSHLKRIQNLFWQ